jgi:NAD(P) transhydrogenase subunit beta
MTGAEATIHHLEIYLGVLIGAVTLSGSVIAFGKLSASIGGKPVLLPGPALAEPRRGSSWCSGSDTHSWRAHSVDQGMMPLVVMSVIAAPLRRSHGDGDRRRGHAGCRVDAQQLLGMGRRGDRASCSPTTCSSSPARWSGSSGAILSYIMCRAMNRNFPQRDRGRLRRRERGTAAKGDAAPAGEVVSVNAQETADMLREAKSVVIVPGYGMAVAQAQHTVFEITKRLRELGKTVRFAIHPVAGRMPGT